jgi:hypothetical protein
MRTRVVLLALVAAGGVARAQSQDIGHKALGTLGLDAGSQPPTGLYANDTVVSYRADRIIDGNGRRVPVALNDNAFENIFAVAGAYELPRLHTYVGASIAMPVSRVTVDVATGDARASLDNFGFGDLFAQPIQIGWRQRRFDLTTGYGFYAPTGHVEPGGIGGVGRGHWTHEVSLGGTVYFDRAQRWRISALSSYERNMPKIGVDIKRGDTIQVQGGIGGHVAGPVGLGLCGYGLWQVTDDSGSALPPVLAGARDVDIGLGPELDVDAPFLRARFTARYTHDVFVRSRTLGSMVLIAVTFSAWTMR